jgi:hypothetical protein
MCPKTREYRAPAEPVVIPELIGAGGLMLLRYTGLSTVTENGDYPGQVSKAKYKFGMEKTVGYVDTRDVPGLLSCFEDGMAVFEAVL